MKLLDLTKDIESRVDDAPTVVEMVRWIQSGQQRLALAVGAKFPDIIDSGGQYDMDAEPVFDARFHEALVLFACARFKEADSSLKEAENFMRQFEEMKKEFVENYEVPEYYRDDRTSQQFLATLGQTEFTITKQGYQPKYGDLKVYVNGIRTLDFKANKYEPTFTLIGITLQANDKVTALWEEHQDLAEPPYSWWSW